MVVTLVPVLDGDVELVVEPGVLMVPEVDVDGVVELTLVVPVVEPGDALDAELVVVLDPCEVVLLVPGKGSQGTVPLGEVMVAPG